MLPKALKKDNSANIIIIRLVPIFLVSPRTWFINSRWPTELSLVVLSFWKYSPGAILTIFSMSPMTDSWLVYNFSIHLEPTKKLVFNSRWLTVGWWSCPSWKYSLGAILTILSCVNSWFLSSLTDSGWFDLVRLKIFSRGKGGARTWWADDLICQQHCPGQHHPLHHYGHHGHHHHHQHHGGLMI